MLLVKKQSFELSSDIRLVKAADVQTACDAQAVIAAAESEAARLVDAAKLAFEEERRKGYAKGLDFILLCFARSRFCKLWLSLSTIAPTRVKFVI
jgi:hypothetical protein